MKKMERWYCVGNQQRKVKSGRGGKERKNKDKHRRKECTQNGDEGREDAHRTETRGGKREGQRTWQGYT